ncbi:MAG: 50S ribosomal protein L25/general stress protein Ctc [Saprospiraceae bacterium]|jgi:large subunit ribosomal protein L25
MNTVSLNGELRTKFGKSATKADLKAGKIPCVLYGMNSENVHFTVSLNDVRDLVYAADFKIADLTVDGKTYRCIIKQVEFDAVKDTVNHVDFLQLIDGHPVKVELPLTFSGSSPGVRNGGKFIQYLRTVKVKAKPEDLVTEVVADISKLKLGSVIRVRDIKLNEGVEILNAPAIPIAGVVVPRSLKSAGALPEDEEGEETAEGEEAAAEAEA